MEHEDVVGQDYELSWLGEDWGIFAPLGVEGLLVAEGSEVIPYIAEQRANGSMCAADAEAFLAQLIEV